MARDEEQTKKSANNNNNDRLKIGKKAAVGLIARQMMGMDPMRGGGNLSTPWGAQLAAGMVGQSLNQQNTQMRNPFYGPALGLMSSQGQQNTQMENPFFGPFLTSSQGQMMGLSTKKGGGFTYNPWNLQINPEEQAKRKSA